MIFMFLIYLLLLIRIERNRLVLLQYLLPAFYFLALLILFAHVYGLIFYFDKWEIFNIAALYELKGYEAISGLPRSWWIETSSGMLFRFPSVFENPITAGYISAFFSMCFFSLRKFFFGIVFYMFAILSVSKGALLYLTLFIIMFSLIKISKISKIIFKKVFNSWFIITSLMVLYILLQSVMAASLKTSASIHLLGLTLPFINMFEYSVFELIFGHGIGSGGNFYKGAFGPSLNLLDWLGSGSESGIGTIFYQLGLSGIIVVASLFYRILFLIGSIEARFILFFYFLNLFMQENLININLLILVFLSILVIESYKSQNNKEYI